MVFGFIPERRSASFRSKRSASPESLVVVNIDEPRLSATWTCLRD